MSKSSGTRAPSPPVEPPPMLAKKASSSKKQRSPLSATMDKRENLLPSSSDNKPATPVVFQAKDGSTPTSAAQMRSGGPAYNQQSFPASSFSQNPAFMDSPGTFMQPRPHGGIMHHNVNTEGIPSLANLRTPELMTLIDGASANSFFNGYRNSPAPFMSSMNGAGALGAPGVQPQFVMTAEQQAAVALVSHSQSPAANMAHGMHSHEANPFARSFEQQIADPRSREANPFAASFVSRANGGQGGAPNPPPVAIKYKAKGGRASAANKRGGGGGSQPPKKRRGSATADTKGMSPADKKVSDRRERNRVAAANCRQRKIDKENTLRIKLGEMKKVHDGLESELQTLETYLAHLKSGGKPDAGYTP